MSFRRNGIRKIASIETTVQYMVGTLYNQYYNAVVSSFVGSKTDMFCTSNKK